MGGAPYLREPWAIFIDAATWSSWEARERARHTQYHPWHLHSFFPMVDAVHQLAPPHLNPHQGRRRPCCCRLQSSKQRILHTVGSLICLPPRAHSQPLASSVFRDQGDLQMDSLLLPSRSMCNPVSMFSSSGCSYTEYGVFANASQAGHGDPFRDA